MISKTKFRSLIRDGLTGEEAGKLIIQNNWMLDNGQKGFLNDKDVSEIKNSLETSRDIGVYNSYLKLYELVDYTLKDARINTLEAEVYILWINKTIDRYQAKFDISMSLIRDIPAIVTQKQYDELKAKQKAYMVKKPVRLDEALMERAGLDSNRWMIIRDMEVLEESELIKAWEPAIQEIKKLIKAGKLKPLRLKKKHDYYEFSRRDIKYLPAKGIPEKLDKLLEEKLSDKETEDLLEMNVFLASEMAEAGLQEWKNYIETYQPNLEESTAAKPPGMMQSCKVAIIQDPDSGDVDEKGYWIERDVLNTRQYPDTEKDRDTLKTFLDAAKLRIKNLLAIQAVLEAIGKLVAVDFLEGVRLWYGEIEALVNILNASIDSLMGYRNSLGLETEGKPLQIKIGRMKPTARSLKYYQERMAVAIGKDAVKEALNNLEYESEEGSLASEMAEEIAEYQEEGTFDD